MHILTEHQSVMALPVGERLALAQQLWESVRTEIESSPLTPDQEIEIKRRLAGIDSGNVQCEPFDIVMKRLSRRWC